LFETLILGGKHHPHVFTRVLLSVRGVVGLFASVSDVDGELLRIIVFWTTLKRFGIIIKVYN
jgi:hypothetical protein